jgi:hypothetical protein
MTRSPAAKDEFDALLDRIESAELDTKVNVASNLATALRIVSSHPAVESLVHACEEEPRFVETACSRLVDLCRRAIDQRYASPHDSAIFAILFVLDRCEPFAATKAAVTALAAPNTYWSTRFAIGLLDDLPQHALQHIEGNPGQGVEQIAMALGTTIHGSASSDTEEESPRSRSAGVLAPRRSLRSTFTRPVQEVTFHE